MRAANYYFQHLDCKVPVILLSDSNPQPQHAPEADRQLSTLLLDSKPDPQHATEADGHLSALQPPHSVPSAAYTEYNDKGYEISDAELDALLAGGVSDDFSLDALKPQDAPAAKKVMSNQARYAVDNMHALVMWYTCKCLA